MLCGGAGCNATSVPSTIQLSSAIPEYWTIAQPAMSWVDDYYDWVSPKSKCCRIFDDGSFCNTTGKFYFKGIQNLGNHKLPFKYPEHPSHS